MYSNSDYKLIKIASYFSVITALIIAIIKGYGWFATSSQSIFASLIDSMLDITSSIINFIAIRLANKPPDYNHRFGHEKFEDLAVFSQSIFFFFSGIFVTYSCIRSLYYKSAASNFGQGIGIMVICIILTLALSLFQTYVIRKTSSTIITADRLHYFTDFLTNITVIISILLSEKFWFVDSLMGIGVSIYIIYSSYSLFKNAIRNLVDEEFDEIDKEKIISTVGNFKEVKGLHDIKTRYAAKKPFIQFHIELDHQMSVKESHQLINKITKELIEIFPKGEIIIYADPHGEQEHNISYPEEGFRA